MYVGEGFYPSRAAGIPVFTRHVGEFEIALREGQSPSPTACRGQHIRRLLVDMPTYSRFTITYYFPKSAGSFFSEE